MDKILFISLVCLGFGRALNDHESDIIKENSKREERVKSNNYYSLLENNSGYFSSGTDATPRITEEEKKRDETQDSTIPSSGSWRGHLDVVSSSEARPLLYHTLHNIGGNAFRHAPGSKQILRGHNNEELGFRGHDLQEALHAYNGVDFGSSGHQLQINNQHQNGECFGFPFALHKYPLNFQQTPLFHRFTDETLGKGHELLQVKYSTGGIEGLGATDKHATENFLFPSSGILHGHNDPSSSGVLTGESHFIPRSIDVGNNMFPISAYQSSNTETSGIAGHRYGGASYPGLGGLQQPPILVPVPVKIPQPYVIKVPVTMTVEKAVEVPIQKQFHLEKPQQPAIVNKVPYIVKPYSVQENHQKN